MAGPVQKEIADLSAKFAKYPKGVTSVSGWLIEGAGANSRLYFTPELDEWIEFPPAAVVHKKELQGTTDPWPRTMLWLENDSAVEYHPSSVMKVQEDFLLGEISKSVSRFVDPGKSDALMDALTHFITIIRLPDGSDIGCSTAPLCASCPH